MANYHDCCVRECTDSDLIGVGLGDTEEGEERICISFEGEELEISERWKKINWTSLNYECAKALYENLQSLSYLLYPNRVYCLGGCGEKLEAGYTVCLTHWRMLPTNLQETLWKFQSLRIIHNEEIVSQVKKYLKEIGPDLSIHIGNNVKGT